MVKEVVAEVVAEEVLVVVADDVAVDVAVVVVSVVVGVVVCVDVIVVVCVVVGVVRSQFAKLPSSNAFTASFRRFAIVSHSDWLSLLVEPASTPPATQVKVPAVEPRVKRPTIELS